MSETMKSRLKRKRPFAGRVHPEESSVHTARKGQLHTEEPGGSAVPAAAWWNSQQLPAVEGLWALALKSAVPDLENQHWDPVPNLPHPCTERPTGLTSDEQQWYELREVPPFPEPSALWSADPVGSSSSQQDPSTQTRPAPHASDKQQTSRSEQRRAGETASPQALSERQPSLHSWEEEASAHGGEERMERAEEDRGSGPVNRRGLGTQLAVSDRVSPQREGGNEDVMKDKEAREVQQGVKGDTPGGGERLQSCPMCQLTFPIGFTQMDCDGHLAQCLSQMNVDVTW